LLRVVSDADEPHPSGHCDDPTIPHASDWRACFRPSCRPP
jgi:hypothetical protein